MYYICTKYILNKAIVDITLADGSASWCFQHNATVRWVQ